MQENIAYIETTPLRKIPGSFPHQATEYSEILDYFGFEYKPVDYYYQVGEIPWVQGWILHISVIAFQFNSLMEILLPVFQEGNVAFKIVRDKSIAIDLLFGYRGYNQLAKLVSIYPENGGKALMLAKILIANTEGFRGPVIPTDIHLGGCVYSRYGSGNPKIAMDASGNVNKLIQDTKGQWLPDPYNIPFLLPDGIRWPFETITSYKHLPLKKTLKNKYRLVSILKADPRGNVWKAVYLKKGFFTSACVIKEGKQNMCANDKGLDIKDRLHWQQKLHKELKEAVPLPSILECFEENGNTYLAMEFIKGISVYEFKGLINGNCLGWHDLSIKQQLAIIDFIKKIIDLLRILHSKGVVHRDITPVNFLIDKDQKIILIDIELAYSLETDLPNPPFGFGSPGYISPEQKAESRPTIKEDIYGLSATMLNLLVGLSPLHFDIDNKKRLTENLFFFIGDYEIAKIITEGLSPNPYERPELIHIGTALEGFRHRISLNINNNPITDNIRANLNASILDRIIQYGINSIAKSPTLMWEGLWISKYTEKEDIMNNMRREYAIYPGLHSGIAGILYFLSRAKGMGFNVNACMESFHKGWQFERTNFLNNLPAIPPGLYNGAAGCALALAEGIRYGLLPNTKENRDLIKKCLELDPVGFDISMGIAGQGIAILQCRDYLEKTTTLQLLNHYVQLLLKHQQKDGSWLVHPIQQAQKQKKESGFDKGVAGITWFLLNYLAIYPNHSITIAVIKALEWLKAKEIAPKFSLSQWKNNKASAATVEEGDAGTYLVFIKGYEILQDIKYKNIIEKTLLKNPAFPLHNDFSQKKGLAGLGELYLEAARVFENDQWHHRAKVLANTFLHTAIEQSSEESCYWLNDQNSCATAEIISGNSGILHFLIRCRYPGKLGYRLLS